MKRLLIIFFLFGLIKVSLGSCAADDRTLTEMLFQGKPGTIFTCKVLTFSTPLYYQDGLRSSNSDGSIDGTATAQIVEIYFGKVDTNIITLNAGSYMTIGKTYLIFTSGNGRVFGFGGHCDRWTKEVTDNPAMTNMLLIVKQFSEIIKNKTTGKFTFKSSKNVTLSEGHFKKGKPIKIWKHYYDNGIIKAEYDIPNGVTTQFSDKGDIKSKNIIIKNVGIYEQYSDKKVGQLAYKFIETKIDSVKMIMETIEYFENGKTKNISNQVNITAKEGNITGTTGYKSGAEKEYYENGNLKLSGQFTKDKRTGLWKWYNEDGTFKTEYDYKDGTTNQ